MEPISLILLLLVGAAAGAAVAVLSWRTVDQWIQAKAIRAGTATIIRQRLADGKYRVVTGVFTPSGAKVASKTWEAAQLDSELARRFGGRNTIRVKT